MSHRRPKQQCRSPHLVSLELWTSNAVATTLPAIGRSWHKHWWDLCKWFGCYASALWKNCHLGHFVGMVIGEASLATSTNLQMAKLTSCARLIHWFAISKWSGPLPLLADRFTHVPILSCGREFQYQDLPKHSHGPWQSGIIVATKVQMPILH